MLWTFIMKSLFPWPAWLASFGCLCLTAANLLAQAPARTPQGRSPERGAVLPETLTQGRSAAARERDADRLFLWLEPFQPMLTAAQLDSFRLGIRERLGQMRVLDDRRRTLALELLQTAVALDTKPERVQEKATALGQVVTELGLQQAELLGSLRPPLTAQQRVEMRVALARMFEQGHEPLSFAPEPVPTTSAPDYPAEPGIWLPTGTPSPGAVPSPRQPPNAPRAPAPR